MQHKWKTKSFLCGLVVAGCLSAATGFAQNTNSADLSGTITDPKGSVIVGATVSVQDVDKGTTKDYTTDKAGLFETGSIVPDHYLVTVTAAGFKTLVRGPITLDVGVQTLNASLEVGGNTEKIVVTADLELLDIGHIDADSLSFELAFLVFDLLENALFLRPPGGKLSCDHRRKSC